MLEISRKKMVTTRKEHECFGCTEVIKKGGEAVFVAAKEDDKHARFHLHPECNKLIIKHKVDIHLGCINALNSAVKRHVDFESQLNEISKVTGAEREDIDERVLKVSRETAMGLSEAASFVGGEILREARGK